MFVVVHAVGAPLVLPFRAANPIGPKWVEKRCYIHATLGPMIGAKTLVVVNAPSPAQAGYFMFQQIADGKPAPGRIRVLAPAIPSVAIRRVDVRTLEVRPEGGFLHWVLDRVFRDNHRPMRLGDEVKLTGMTALVTALTDDGRPAAVAFRFDVPLESDSLVWLCFKGRGFEPFLPPAVGEASEIRFDWRAVLIP